MKMMNKWYNGVRKLNTGLSRLPGYKSPADFVLNPGESLTLSPWLLVFLGVWAHLGFRCIFHAIPRQTLHSDDAPGCTGYFSAKESQDLEG
ncbi:hypothetical protein KQX54_008240 [Cotesia glomerata]|uniref:Uncharacterized protein n=1 Tax=Cotesia glomerata TaxID=32391 RepID=A0AAV7IVH3_COTGL|nr:hypothetical protein KQX54_008240 [Cotesia glomerata]